MMQHYLSVKEKYKDCIIFYRLGDFYEMFFDDARTASRVLDLTLTGRDCGLEERAPMCGVPYHAADAYIAKLVSAGYKVAICEQLEDPSQAKGMVARDVIKVVTAGTITDENYLDASANNYIACVCRQGEDCAVAWSDITTGVLNCTQYGGPECVNKAVSLLVRLSVSEIICNDEMLFAAKDVPEVSRGVLPPFSSYLGWTFGYKAAEKNLLEQLGAGTLSSFGVNGHDAAVCACGALLEYLKETQKHALANIDNVNYISDRRYMQLDNSAVRNLEIVRSMSEGKKYGTLLWLLDKTKTPMGARLLNNIILSPLGSADAVNYRLDGVEELFDATVVRKLREAGMVCLGKLNCDEFAMGSGNENSAYGRVHNPWDPNAVPGGSSGGSSACVAAGLAPIATGTDTGGSIREPASFTGLTGVKPTYGRPSRFGMIAFASSLDTAGLLAHSAEDCAAVLGSMVGFDPADSTSVDRPTEDFSRSLTQGMEGIRIGVPRSWMGKGLDPEVAASIDKVLDTYRAMGATVVDIELPMAELGVPVYYVVACAEASSNLSRFDGVRYGHRAAEYEDILDMIKKSRDEGFGPEPKRRIMIGTYVLSHGYYDAYYLKAQRVRRLIAKEFHDTFRKVDVIVTPVTTGTAYDFGANADPVSAYLSDLYTVPASLAGLPGVAMPCGMHSNGRPIGVQLIGENFSEARLLGIAHAWQSVTDWHLRHPAGY